jgi:hypothetical protein
MVLEALIRDAAGITKITNETVQKRKIILF